LENIDDIKKRRTAIWSQYYNGLKEWAANNNVRIPYVPSFATNNAHMFYLVFSNIEQRTKLINKLKENNISAVFHYLSLHKSPFYHDKHDGRELDMSDYYSDCLVRLPMYYELTDKDVQYIISVIINNG